MLLEDKVAVISGVGVGMGREMALAFAREGAGVAVSARTREIIDPLVDEIRSGLGRPAIALTMDVTEPEQREDFVAAVGKEFGHIDILVNNAAHPGNRKTLVDSQMRSWRRAMEVNFFATLELTKLVVPWMAGREGRIVMINTQASLGAAPSNGSYGASKAALKLMTETLAHELGPEGIRVNGVHPGPIWGEHFDEFVHLEADRQQIPYDECLKQWTDKQVLRYIAGPDEIAGTVLYLVSDLARPVTGQSISVG